MILYDGALSSLSITLISLVDMRRGGHEVYPGNANDNNIKTKIENKKSSTLPNICNNK